MKLIIERLEVRGQNETITTLEFEGSPAEIRREVRQAFAEAAANELLSEVGLVTQIPDTDT